MQLFKTTHIDFIGKRKTYYVVSLIITVAGIAAAMVKGVEYGIDFEGGIEAAVQFDKPVDAQALRAAAQSGGFDGAEIKSYGGEDNQYLVRIKNDEADITGRPAADAVRPSDRLQAVLAAAFPGNKITVLK